MLSIRWVSDIIKFRVLSSGISGVSITILANHWDFSAIFLYACKVSHVAWLSLHLVGFRDSCRVLTIYNLTTKTLAQLGNFCHIWSSGKHLNKWTTKAWTAHFHTRWTPITLQKALRTSCWRLHRIVFHSQNQKTTNEARGSRGKETFMVGSKWEG